MMQQTIQAALRGKIGARDIANVAYELAISGLGKSRDFTPVGFSTAEQLTVLAAPLRSCLKLLATAAERRVGDFNALGLANTTCAFAKAGFRQPSVALGISTRKTSPIQPGRL